MARGALGLSRGGRRRPGGGAPTPSPTPAPLTAVAANGWQATVTAPADLSLLPATVSRQGFDAAGSAATHTETLYLTKRVRQAYPNQAILTANGQALSDYVYATDTIAGVTNASAETSPKPVANWVMPHRAVVGNSVELEVVAFHRNARAGKQVACVVFRATDGANIVTATVAAAAVSGRAGDCNAVLSYKAALDISPLNAGLITCHARVYPWIGESGSVLDSADQSAGREFSARYFLKNTTLAAAPPYAFVSKSGNNGTGVVSTNAATAKASPFATFVGAIDALHTAYAATTGIDGAIIQFGEDGGTPHVLGDPSTTRTQKVAAITLTRDPVVARANCRVSFGAAAWYPQTGSNATFIAPVASGAVRFADIAIVRTGAQAITAYPHAMDVIFDDVDFDNGGFNFKWLNSAYAATHDYWYGATITNAVTPLAAFTAEQHCCWRGISCDANSAGIEGGLVVGCNWSRPGAIGPGVSGRSQSGSILAFNKLTRIAGSGNFTAVIGDANTVTGSAIVQNLFETTGTGNATAAWIEGDGAAGSTVHVILHQNTFAGAWGNGRCNLFYDEGATARTHKLMSCQANIHVQINTKSDVFRGATQGGGDASSRTGNFAYAHGVGCDAEFSQYIDAANGGVGTSFAQDYPGMRASLGTSNAARNDPLFTSYAGTTWNGSVYSAGGGGGDYALQSGSPCRARLPSPVLSHDLGGAPRAAINDSSGAFA